MQSRRRRGNRASVAGKNGLISLFVGGISARTAFDVRREGSLTEIIDDLIKGLAGFKSDQSLAAVQQLNNFGREPGSAKDYSRTFV